MTQHSDRLRAVRADLDSKVLESRKAGSTLIGCLYEDSDDKRRVRYLLQRHEQADNDLERAMAKTAVHVELDKIRARYVGQDIPWEVLILEASVVGIFGTYGEMLEHDERTLRAADEPWQRVVSLINLSDTLRRVGRSNEAVGFALDALELDPHNPSALSVLLLALLRNGDTAEAGRLFAAYPKELLRREGNVLRNHLRIEPEFRDYEPELPELAECVALANGPCLN